MLCVCVSSRRRPSRSGRRNRCLQQPAIEAKRFRQGRLLRRRPVLPPGHRFMRVIVSLFVCSLGYELGDAHLGRQQQRVPGKDCIDLLLLDLIIAVFGVVEGSFAAHVPCSNVGAVL